MPAGMRATRRGGHVFGHFVGNFFQLFIRASAFIGPKFASCPTRSACFRNSFSGAGLQRGGWCKDREAPEREALLHVGCSQLQLARRLRGTK